MNIKQFRVEAGHYRIKDWTVFRGGPNYWQVRDQLDDIVESFRTCTDAIRYAVKSQ